MLTFYTKHKHLFPKTQASFAAEISISLKIVRYITQNAWHGSDNRHAPRRTAGIGC